MASNNKLVKQPSNVSLGANQELPAFLKERMGNQSGLEDADKDDFTLPRLSICQALTPQRKKSDPSYIEGLEEGMFFNSVTGKIYGHSINVIALFLTKQRIKFNEPIGAGIDCQSPNGKTGGHYSPESCRACQYSQWGSSSKGGGQACTEFKNLVCIIEGEQSPIIFSTKSTMISTTKQWLSQMKMANMPVFSRIWQLKTVEVHKNGNDFYNYQYAPVRWVAEDQFKQCEEFFNSLHDKNITFDPNDLEDEDMDQGGPSL